MPFDLLKDLEPIAQVATAPSVLVVGPSFNPGSVKELIDTAKKQPGKFSYASAGIGSPAHMTAELFKVRHQLFVVHVPYTGAPAAMLDQIGGRIDYQFANAAVALPQIRAGKVKALAVTSASRLPALPQVPTMAEAGVANFEVDQWLGLLAPRGLPKPIADRFSAEVAKIQGSEDFRNALLQANINPAPASSASGFETAIKQDIDKWAAVVKAQGIKPE
jgi:tripartite-type tricarboxylate transporter receptor subunit TctC